MLGQVAHRAGQYAAARTHYERALELFRVTNDSQGAVATLSWLGAMAASTDRPEHAVNYLISAMAAAGPRNPITTDLVAQLSVVRSRIGAVEFDELLRTTVARRGSPDEEFVDRLRDAVAKAGERDDESVPPPFGGPPETPPKPPVPGGGQPCDDEPQIINIWISEREHTPTVPLAPRQRYTLVFRVGMPNTSNIAEGPREIPRADIPPDGLATTWVVSSTDVVLMPHPEHRSTIRTDTADSGGSAQWMAAFELTVPHRGDSEERWLSIVPLSEGKARRVRRCCPAR